LVNDRIVLEIKSVEALAPVHTAQVLTYMKLGKYSLGLLLNFNVPLLKNGIKRYLI
jgi:GxxExxY protein